MLIGGFDIEVEYRQLCFRLTVKQGSCVQSVQGSTFYIKGNYDKLSCICRADEEEFYKDFRNDFGSLHVELHGVKYLVYSMSICGSYVKVFMDSSGLVGGVVINSANEVYSSPSLDKVLNKEMIGGLWVC